MQRQLVCPTQHTPFLLLLGQCSVAKDWDTLNRTVTYSNRTVSTSSFWNYIILSVIATHKMESQRPDHTWLPAQVGPLSYWLEQNLCEAWTCGWNYAPKRLAHSYKYKYKPFTGNTKGIICFLQRKTHGTYILGVAQWIRFLNREVK